MAPHILDALMPLLKYTGSYDKSQVIHKHYSLKWINGNKSLQSIHRFFNSDLSPDVMLQPIKEMVDLPPVQMADIVRLIA